MTKQPVRKSKPGHMKNVDLACAVSSGKSKAYSNGEVKKSQYVFRKRKTQFCPVLIRTPVRLSRKAWTWLYKPTTAYDHSIRSLQRRPLPDDSCEQRL